MKERNFWIRQVIALPVILAIVACGGGKDDQHLVQVAKEHSAQNRMREAALELRNALQLNPENAEARYLLGYINLAVGDIAAAEKEFSRAGAFGWPEEDTTTGLARALVVGNEYKRVIEEIEVKEVYSPVTRANLYGLRAIAYAGVDELDKARASLAAGSEIDANALFILNAGIQLHIAAGDLDEARAVLARATAMYPDDRELMLQGAVIAMMNKDNDAAVNIYKQVIERDPGGLVTVYGRKARLELVRLEIQNRNLDYAESLLVPLLKQSTNDPLVNYMGGMLAYEQGDLQLAEARLLKVLKFAPDHAQTQLLYGAVSYAQEDLEQAAYYLGKYVSAVPDNLNARKLLGRTYMMLGQHSDAQETLQQGLEDGMEDAELQALAGLSYLHGGNALAGIEGLEKAIHAEPGSKTFQDELAKAYILAGQAEDAIRLLNDMLAEGGESQQTEALLVYAHLRKGQFDKAIEAALDMLEKYPGNPAVLTLAGSVFAASDNNAEARKYFNKALHETTDFVPATMALARLEESEGNEERAEELYREIVRSTGNPVEPMIALARLAELRGDTQSMLEWLEQARKQEPASEKPRMILAEYYLRQNQPEKADLYIDEAIKTAPRDNTLLAMQGRVLMAQGQYNEALSPLNKLVANVPDSVYARVLIGETYLKLGQTMRARKQLEAALAKQPYSASALALMATAELKLGNYEDSLDYAEKIQKVEPEHYMGYEIAGDGLVMSNRNSEAKLAYQEAWKRSQSAELAIKLAEVSSRLGQPEEATGFLHEWLDGNPDDARVLQFLGEAYQNTGQEKRAIQTYEKALGADPDNVVVLNNLAWLYSQTGDPKALELAERAYRIRPEDGGVQDTYGWILVQQGQSDKGRRILEQALEQLPKVAEVRYHYAVALLESGEQIAARKILQKLLDEEQAFEGRDDAIRLLQ